MTKEQVLQAFRDNQPVTTDDSCLYQIVEINLNNGEVLLDKVLFDDRKGECRSHHLPKVLAKWEDLCVPRGITMTKEEYKEKLNKLLEGMDTLDDAYGYYENDEFDFDYIMQLHDIADDALDLAEEAEDVFDRD
ncbi:hypothetical protein ACT5E2_06745 [Limosilactobacillus mucosae]|uniref:hypothetical protein n=1 Tax=Limosilactobacillus mucosae TaxID=97478 RepID=UPI004039E448